MKFEIGKYYKGIYDKITYKCIDIHVTFGVVLYDPITASVLTMKDPHLPSWAEVIVPRTFEIALCDDGRIFDPKYKPEQVHCELIKVVEVK